MEFWQLLLVIGTLASTLSAFAWVAIRLKKIGSGGEVGSSNNLVASATQEAFTDEFRAELRSRAREQFQKIMQENAMFLQQDIRVSAAQLEEFMKQEVIATLQKEMARHQQTIDQTKQMVTNTIAKNEQQHQQELQTEKERRLQKFDEHMTDVVRTYVVAAVGDVIDVERQLSLVIDSLNAHKSEIFEDIRREH